MGTIILSLFFSGAIGDVYSLLQFTISLPNTVVLASGCAGNVAELCGHLGIQTKVIECHRTFFTKSEVESVYGCFEGEDWSISRIFPMILEDKILFQRPLINLFKTRRLLDEDYVIVNPASTNVHHGRNLENAELNWIMEQTDKRIVVINKGLYKVPKHPRVIDKSNSTTFLECLSLIKYASAAYLIDSWLACAACNMTYPVWVKSVNPQYYHYRKCYQQTCGDNIKTVPYFG
jgi:hypothetical protein